jgi:hypothetical protein
MSPRRRVLALTALVALVFGTGPTVGDIGSCGTSATLLDAATFAQQRKQADCARCTSCGITTRTCTDACDPKSPPTAGWPSTCVPLQHDGDVCIRALYAASCDDYSTFVSDVAPALPTECDFCRDIPEGGLFFGGDP